MPGLYSITTRSTGTVLTSAIYNADHQNHVDNHTPQMMDDYSANVLQMQSVTDPGGVGSESLASSFAGELERLRFVVKVLHGGAQWYAASAFASATLTFTNKTFTNPGYTDQTLADAATIAWDMSLGGIATVTLGAVGRTMGLPTNLKKGVYLLHVIQDGTGSRTISVWNAVFKWQAGVAPVLSTGAGKRDVFSFICDGTNLYGNAMLDVR